MEDQILRIFKEARDIHEGFVNDNLTRIVEVVEALTGALKAGNKVLLFGNGGSAAQAQHIAAEFVNRFLIERPPLPAVALTTDTSVLTSIGNDYDFAEIFAKQVRAIGQPGDVAWGISTSGSSANVVRGLEAAKKIGMLTVAFTGRDGGAMAKVADFCLHAAAASVPRIQEVQLTAGHVICELVDVRLFQRPDMK